jgi:hypothetical protein
MGGIVCPDFVLRGRALATVGWFPGVSAQGLFWLGFRAWVLFALAKIFVLRGRALGSVGWFPGRFGMTPCHLTSMRRLAAGF